jgi:hypothetical protein
MLTAVNFRGARPKLMGEKFLFLERGNIDD